MIKNKPLLERFFRYVQIDTQSDEEAAPQPSTEKQRNLASLLAEELRALGARVDYDEEFCYVYARIPGSEPALGFVAHMDTSPAASGENVRPRIIENYQGEDFLLKTEEFPELLHHFGEDLIATDGTTLLGADDKAGVAEIMTMAAYFAAHPEEAHRTVCIAFTPDEEIGRGTEHFDPARFGAKEAYTVDGGKLGELEYECFNGAKAKIIFHGKSVHPGSAKNTMINAVRIAAELNGLLPEAEIPEHTEGYEGFYYLDSIHGDTEQAVSKYILRDHDLEKLKAKKSFLTRCVEWINAKYGSGVAELDMADQYYNMAIPMRDHMELVDRAKDALRALGVEPVATPIRGGTDGAALTYMGIPCPNLCTGGYNYHGRFEYASVQEMETVTELLIALARI